MNVDPIKAISQYQNVHKINNLTPISNFKQNQNGKKIKIVTSDCLRSQPSSALEIANTNSVKIKENLNGNLELKDQRNDYECEKAGEEKGG